ncbi:MAG: hypothetical protein QM472_07885 [Spirochaetota bacterium]|nr:hypothetical protein [Spirochaetota bacterium]
MNQEIIAAALEWLEAQIAENPFADVGVSFSVHDGKIAKIQKTVSVKSKI